jgi:hypothetical protein
MRMRGLLAVASAASRMTSQGTAHGRFQRAIHARNLLHAETAAREMGGLSLADALAAVRPASASRVAETRA